MSKPSLGLKNVVSATITDGELAAFKKLQAERGGSMSAIAREGVLMLLNANGYQPTDTKKAS